jgi:hypothetical protein
MCLDPQTEYDFQFSLSFYSNCTSNRQSVAYWIFRAEDEVQRQSYYEQE